jgi:hypothetical protein
LYLNWSLPSRLVSDIKVAATKEPVFGTIRLWPFGGLDISLFLEFSKIVVCTEGVGLVRDGCSGHFLVWSPNGHGSWGLCVVDGAKTIQPSIVAEVFGDTCRLADSLDNVAKDSQEPAREDRSVGILEVVGTHGRRVNGEREKQDE